ncbi:unnamed protein product [Lactuca virosa]|uniref:Uncharacterized protein n=1 Tax=Lactuca virosa TaxID=75947 RepID=A0AAU9MXF0_9ASTR|nr:unnamed protein product [Lactuca virosa]
MVVVAVTTTKKPPLNRLLQLSSVNHYQLLFLFLDCRFLGNGKAKIARQGSASTLLIPAVLAICDGDSEVGDGTPALPPTLPLMFFPLRATNNNFIVWDPPKFGVSKSRP